MGDQQFFLKWNDFQTNMVTSFRHLRDEKSFTDVTLACEGQTCKAHKMVLSACSPYFKSLLEENPSKHPIIILKDVSYLHLQAILEFMYAGEVNVSQEQLPAFLKTAARLKVKGLAEPPPQMPSIKREGQPSVCSKDFSELKHQCNINVSTPHRMYFYMATFKHLPLLPYAIYLATLLLSVLTFIFNFELCFVSLIIFSF